MRHRHPRLLKTRVIVQDPLQSAHEAGLRYVTDAMPGIRRRRLGRSVAYIGSNGRPIRDAGELARFRSLTIPPAWRNVWICADPNGHIQATGVDAKGRKQYRYHPRWREVRDATKYDRMIAFGEALPAIRERVAADLALRGLPREKVLAAVVRLLDETAIRVGNEEYVRENESYGLTTLRNEHVEVAGSRLRLQFRGKSGKQQVVEVQDRRVAKIVKSCQELPGQELFQYIDCEDERRLVESADVNGYLRAITGEEFSAKDFRTWAGTVIAAEALRQLGAAPTRAAAKLNVAAAVREAAARLGNTPTVCRKCYVHPGVVGAYLNGSLAGPRGGQRPQAAEGATFGLSVDEQAVLDLLLGLEQAAQREVKEQAKAG